MRNIQSVCAVFGLLCSVAVGATDTESVYVRKGKGGTEYSNTPQAGAKKVDLTPLSVIHRDAATASQSSPASEKAENEVDAVPQQGVEEVKKSEVVREERTVQPSDAIKPPYQSFFVEYPKNGAVIGVALSALEVRLHISPVLDVANGDVIKVAINGKALPESFTSSSVRVPESFWQGEPPLPNQIVLVEATVVNEAGETVQMTEPVAFRFRPMHHRKRH